MLASVPLADGTMSTDTGTWNNIAADATKIFRACYETNSGGMHLTGKG